MDLSTLNSTPAAMIDVDDPHCEVFPTIALGSNYRVGQRIICEVCGGHVITRLIETAIVDDITYTD